MKETTTTPHQTNEELVQHVWATSPERTPLERLLAERLSHALDAIAALEDEVDSCGVETMQGGPVDG